MFSVKNTIGLIRYFSDRQDTFLFHEVPQLNMLQDVI